MLPLPSSSQDSLTQHLSNLSISPTLPQANGYLSYPSLEFDALAKEFEVTKEFKIIKKNSNKTTSNTTSPLIKYLEKFDPVLIKGHITILSLFKNITEGNINTFLTHLGKQKLFGYIENESLAFIRLPSTEKITRLTQEHKKKNFDDDLQCSEIIATGRKIISLVYPFLTSSHTIKKYCLTQYKPGLFRQKQLIENRGYQRQTQLALRGLPVLSSKCFFLQTFPLNLSSTTEYLHLTKAYDGDLIGYFNSLNKKLNKQDLKYFFNSLTAVTLKFLDCVRQLHLQEIAHLDLKPNNFVYKINKKTKEVTVKMIDFAFSKNFGESPENQGTEDHFHPLLKKKFEHPAKKTPTKLDSAKKEKSELDSVKKPKDVNCLAVDSFSIGMSIFYCIEGLDEYLKNKMYKDLLSGNKHKRSNPPPSQEDFQEFNNKLTTLDIISKYLAPPTKAFSTLSPPPTWITVEEAYYALSKTIPFCSSDNDITALTHNTIEDLLKCRPSIKKMRGKTYFNLQSQPKKSKILLSSNQNHTECKDYQTNSTYKSPYANIECKNNYAKEESKEAPPKDQGKETSTKSKNKYTQYVTNFLC